MTLILRYFLQKYALFFRKANFISSISLTATKRPSVFIAASSGPGEKKGRFFVPSYRLSASSRTSSTRLKYPCPKNPADTKKPHPSKLRCGFTRCQRRLEGEVLPSGTNIIKLRESSRSLDKKLRICFRIMTGVARIMGFKVPLSFLAYKVHKPRSPQPLHESLRYTAVLRYKQSTKEGRRSWNFR